MTFDIYGHFHRDLFDAEQIRDMFSPVRCVCGGVYDIGKVEITGRYTDCTLWKAPCCGRTADDRYETGWSSIKHYDKIDKREVLGR